MSLRLPPSPWAHPWDVSPREARAIQESLRGRILTEDRLGPVRRIAGIDVGFEDGGRVTRAAAVVLALPALEVVEQVLERCPTVFPYVPGLLSFRELPAVIRALGRLSAPPDLVICDGQGLAHPRRFGLACHLGLLTDLPTVGAAKSRLIGTHGPLPIQKGAWVPLMDGEETIGAVLRTRSGVAPLFVSVGHRVCLDTAIAYVLACCPRYRLPETTRRAHRLASHG